MTKESCKSEATTREEKRATFWSALLEGGEETGWRPDKPPGFFGSFEFEFRELQERSRVESRRRGYLARERERAVN